jgi:hypothetical protein
MKLDICLPLPYTELAKESYRPPCEREIMACLEGNTDVLIFLILTVECFVIKISTTLTIKGKIISLIIVTLCHSGAIPALQWKKTFAIQTTDTGVDTRIL